MVLEKGSLHHFPPTYHTFLQDYFWWWFTFFLIIIRSDSFRIWTFGIRSFLVIITHQKTTTGIFSDCQQVLLKTIFIRIDKTHFSCQGVIKCKQSEGNQPVVQLLHWKTSWWSILIIGWMEGRVAGWDVDEGPKVDMRSKTDEIIRMGDMRGDRWVNASISCDVCPPDPNMIHRSTLLLFSCPTLSTRDFRSSIEIYTHILLNRSTPTQKEKLKIHFLQVESSCLHVLQNEIEKNIQRRTSSSSFSCMIIIIVWCPHLLFLLLLGCCFLHLNRILEPKLTRFSVIGSNLFR